MGTAASGNAGVGTIKVVTGDVKIIGVDGVARQAMVGDKVFAKETIQTAANAVVQVQLENGRMLDLGRDSKIALDDDVLNVGQGGATPAPATTDIAALQAQIAAGADPSKVAEATAAGGAPGAGGGADGGGGTAVTIDQANSTGQVTSGFSTGVGGIAFPDLPEALPPLELEIAPPVISVSVTVQVQVDVGTGGGDPGGGGGVLPVQGFPDDPDGDGVVISGNVASLIEGTSTGESSESRTVVFIIKLDQVFDQDVTVTYTISGVTATADGDFMPVNGLYVNTVTIPAGQTEIRVPIDIVQDHIDEPGLYESFTITLSNPINATINPDSSAAEARIYDDDLPPVAVNDTNWVQEDAFTEEGGEGGIVTATGNVLQNQSHDGAPDEESRGDVVDTDNNPTETITVTNAGTYTGTYGTLVLNSDGSYIYTLNNNSAAVQDLEEGQEVTDTFTYTITDGFNPQSTPATLTITIFGTKDNEPPTIDARLDARVSEEGLEGIGLPGVFPDGDGGQQDLTNATHTDGDFTVSDPDGDALTVTLSVPTTDLFSQGEQIQWEGDGTSNLIGYILIGEENRQDIIEIRINDNGHYDVYLYGPVDHETANVEDESSFDVSVTVTDTNGASATGILTVTVEDDSPVVTITANTEATAGLDESATTSGISAIDTLAVVKGNDPDVSGSGTISSATSAGSVVNVTTEAYGADGAAASGAKVYSLTVTDPASGLTLTDGSAITLSLLGNGVVVGTVSGGTFNGQAAFAISIDAATGVVTVEQYLSLDHPAEATAGNAFNSYDESLALATGSLGVTVTLMDADNDTTASAAADISSQITFDDDGPGVTVNDDMVFGALSVVEASAGVGQSVTITAPTFTATAVDGQTSSVSYDLAINGGPATGLSTTSGFAITLVQVNADTIQGQYNGSNVAFTISISGNQVTLVSNLALEHSNAPQGTGEDNTLDLGSLINVVATVTVTDGDGDQISNSTSAISPLSLTISDTDPTLTVNNNMVFGALSVVEASAGVGQSVTITAPTFTATAVDGQTSSVSYDLALSGGTVTGLMTTAGNFPITLVQVNADTIQGQYNGGQVAFTVSISGSQVTLVSSVALEHDNTQGVGEDNTLDLGSLINVVATVTVTDGDGDQISNSTSAISPLSLTISDTDPTLTLTTNGLVDNEAGLQVLGTISAAAVDGVHHFDLRGSVAPDGLTYSYSTDGSTLTATDGLGDTVFTVTVNPNGSYVYTLIKPSIEVVAVTPDFDTVDIPQHATEYELTLFASYDSNGVGIGDPLGTVTFAVDNPANQSLTTSQDGLGINNNLMNTGEKLWMTFDSLVSDATFAIGNFNDTDAMVWKVYDADGNLLDMGTISGSFLDEEGNVVNVSNNSSANYSINIAANGLDEGIQFTSMTLESSGNNNSYKFTGFSIEKALTVEDQTYNFNVVAIDGDGDSSNTGTFSVTVNGTDDTLTGTSSNDYIVGGAGDDILTGNAGADTFVWKSGDTGSDIVTDFSQAQVGEVLNVSELIQADGLVMSAVESGGHLQLQFKSGTTVVQSIDLNNLAVGNDAAATTLMNQLLANNKIDV